MNPAGQLAGSQTAVLASEDDTGQRREAKQGSLSNIRVFSNESTLHIRWPKYQNFSFSISPSNEHSGLISFTMDWLDLLAVQGTLKSLLQNHSSKASILRRSAFFIVQLSHPYMTTGKRRGLRPA
ncbi:hypothetical protein R6Z07M_004023 [Ovis aries]